MDYRWLRPSAHAADKSLFYQGFVSALGGIQNSQPSDP